MSDEKIRVGALECLASAGLRVDGREEVLAEANRIAAGLSLKDEYRGHADDLSTQITKLAKELSKHHYDGA